MTPVAGQFRQHYREPYDLRRLQRVGNRCRMHWDVQVGIFALRSVRLTLIAKIAIFPNISKYLIEKSAFSIFFLEIV